MMTNLIYDRTLEDVAEVRRLLAKLDPETGDGLTAAEQAKWDAGLKGAYNFTDLNRVESAVKTLAAALTSAGYPVEITPVLKGSSRVPAGYTEVEWIQSSGTQYIDTGASFSNGVRVETKFNLTSITASSKKTPIFGAHNASEPYGRDYLSVDLSKNFEIGGGAGYRYFKNNTIATNVDYEVEASNIPGQETLIVNGELYESTGGQAYATPFTDLPLYLFRVNTTNDQWFENASMKLYHAKFYDDKNVLVRNFTPCKNPSGEVGLYDYVTKAFYGNVGGGSLPDGYTELEYLQSTGAQYIDSGVKGDSDVRVTADFEITAFGSGTTFIFGAQGTDSIRYTLGMTSAGAFRSDFGTAMTSGSAASLNTRYSADKNGNVCTVGGQTLTSAAATFTGTTNIYLFGRSYSSVSCSKIKMYRCKMYKAGTLIRDFVPCKNPDGVAGLYDIVNGTFYTNQGSGTFTAGADIVGFTAGAEVGKAEDREWQEGDVLYRSQWTTYLDNVQRLRDAYYTLAETGALPAPGDKLTYTGANTIEKVLADIGLLLDGMKASYRRCGTFRAGNNAAHLPLKGSV